MWICELLFESNTESQKFGSILPVTDVVVVVDDNDGYGVVCC